MHNTQHRFLKGIVLLASLLSVAAASAARAAGSQAQDPKSILDRVYSVPQAERGEQRFRQSCSSCHTTSDFSGGAFAERWSGQTLGEAYEFLSVNMPENDPGGLKPEEYASVLAFILRMNGYPVGSDDMPADKAALKKFEIVPNPK